MSHALLRSTIREFIACCNIEWPVFLSTVLVRTPCLSIMPILLLTDRHARVKQARKERQALYIVRSYSAVSYLTWFNVAKLWVLYLHFITHCQEEHNTHKTIIGRHLLAQRKPDSLRQKRNMGHHHHLKGPLLSLSNTYTWLLYYTTTSIWKEGPSENRPTLHSTATTAVIKGRKALRTREPPHYPKNALGAPSSSSSLPSFQIAQRCCRSAVANPKLGVPDIPPCAWGLGTLSLPLLCFPTTPFSVGIPLEMSKFFPFFSLWPCCFMTPPSLCCTYSRMTHLFADVLSSLFALLLRQGAPSPPSLLFEGRK